MASRATGGWLTKLRTESLPLAIALQGLGLFLLAFFINAPVPQDDSEDATAAGRLADDSSVQLASETQIPADLHPEKLRLPRFPNPQERAQQRQPASPEKESEKSPGATSTLNGLRVDTVWLQSPTAVQVALALPEAPDRLEEGMISMRRFDKKGKSGRTGRRGWGGIGGIGVGGIGMGEGPSCHPRRPGEERLIPRNPRNPVSDAPPVIGLAIGRRH